MSLLNSQIKHKYYSYHTSLISKPSPLLRNKGNSTNNIYHPKLFNTCEIHSAQNGIDVRIPFQGIFLFFCKKKSFFKTHKILNLNRHKNLRII